MSKKPNNAVGRLNYWSFGWYFFVFFFIMGAYFPFFPIWLNDVVHISKTYTGMIFSAIAIVALICQPFAGTIADKIGMKKYLLWFFVVLLLFFGPFFVWVFKPLLQQHIMTGVVIGGLYLGITFSVGAISTEAFVEKVSRLSNFEYGRTRMFGCWGWAIVATITGILFTINNEFVFWMGSGAAVILAILLFISKPEQGGIGDDGKVIEDKYAKEPFSLKLAISLLKRRDLWILTLFVLGISGTYDIFDQQFANFFTSFFPSVEAGTRTFGYVTTMGEILNGIIMGLVPFVANRIGAKRTMLVAGWIMTIRICGSAFATNYQTVIVLKVLHMLEVPFMFVGVFKYITTYFNPKYSATIYLVAWGFMKQLYTIFMSTLVGWGYDAYGYKPTYLMLGMVALTCTIICVFAMAKHPPQHENEALTPASEAA